MTVLLLAASAALAFAAWKAWPTRAPDGALAAVPAAPLPDHAPLAGVVVAEDALVKGYGTDDVLEALAARGLAITVLSAKDQAALAADAAYGVARWSAPLRQAVTWRPPAVDTMRLRAFGPLVSQGWREGIPERRVAVFAPARAASDDGPDPAAVAAALAPSLGGKVATRPYAHDGTNILVGRGFCVAGQSGAPGSFDVYPGIPAALLQKDSDCPTLFLVPKPPHPSLDRYVMLVDDRTAFVAEVRDEALTAVYPDAVMIPPEFKTLQRRLDEVATELQSLVRVERLPLPLPYRGVWRSYTTAFLANGLAVVPRFRQFGWGHGAYPDASLAGRYETMVEESFRRHGWQVQWAPGDALAYNGAGWRDVLYGVPAADPRWARL